MFHTLFSNDEIPIWVLGVFHELVNLFVLLIGLLTNFPLKHGHAVLYAIARSVHFGLKITSSFVLGSMDAERFTKSRAQWNSFIEAVDLEVCAC